jgi:transglutaminase-like putative cysteine protease
MFVLMLRCRSHACVILTVALIAATCLSAQTANKSPNKVSFEIGPMPSWVKPIEPGSDVGVGADNAGMVYLLADRQENLQRNAFYYREVRKIISEKGIESGASISARFNPTFEKLVFNSIKVIRNGTVSDRLDRSRIQLVPKEKEPDRSSYDPSLSARMVLDDVRVGDVVELALTIEGANPLNRGKYSKIYLVQWEALIVRNVLRLFHSADRKFAVQADNGAREPTITTTNDVTEVWYEDNNVPGRTIEDDVPDDYEPRQLLEVSDFHTWAEVAAWAMPLFETAPAHSSGFSAEVEKLRAISDPEQRVVTALEFVEDKLRYVKVGERIGARRLTPPDEVLRRGFADKMDKALLLLALLRGSDIDAAPAVVSWSFRGMIRKLFPSTDALDDTIVQVRLGGRTYWLDTAATAQRGPLSQLYIPRFGYALVLRPGTTELTPVEPSPGSLPVKKIIENYRVPPPDKIPELEVISEYRGLAADRTRAFFRENTREEIQKRYLEYYTRTYPDAKAAKAPWYEELPGENACRVTESYIVPRLWQLSDDKSRYSLYLQPLEMYSALGSTISPQRQDPLKLEYPNTVIEEINVQMFEDWPLNAERASINNEFFRMRDEPSGNGSTLQLRYSYETLKDRVDVAAIEKFNEAISKAKDTLGYTLRYQTPEQIKRAKSLATFNWAVAAGAFCFFATASFLAYGYFRDSKLVQQLPPPVDASARLNGIGGWLILLAIGQILLPLRFIKPSWDVVFATMNTTSWRSLTDPIGPSYNAWWAPALLFELFFNVGAFLFSVLLVALFFTKKAAWRRAFAVFLIFVLLGAILDTVLVDRIPSAAEPVLTSLLGLAPIAVAAAIWIPYVSVSKRVHATFRY